MINDKGVIVRVQSSMVLNQVIHGKHSLDRVIEQAYKEIDTQPGMTKLSLVPEIAAFRGISFIKLIEWMLKDASSKK